VIKHIIYCDLYDWTALIGECILCFAYTFRDIKTTDGIFNMGESYFNKIKSSKEKIKLLEESKSITYVAQNHGLLY